MQEEPTKYTLFFHQRFNSTILSSTCFEELSVRHQEDCTNNFMVFIIHLYKQSSPVRMCLIHVKYT